MDQPQAKKRLGQHWLEDQQVLAAICDSAEIADSDTVLEIGPGQGTLTRHLLRRAQKVIAIELDEVLAAKMKAQERAGNLEVITGNILQFDLTSLPAGYKVVANIPYYLTSNLLRLLSESPNPPSLAVLLVQKEVAERAAALSGDMSLLSVSVQIYFEVSAGQVVPKERFTPPPKVGSQVLILRRRGMPLFPDLDEKLFFRIVKAGFSQRRKKLRSSLSGGLHLPIKTVEKDLASAGLSPHARPQELSLEQWHQLYLCMKDARLDS